MEILVTKILTPFVLPPGINIVMGVAGLGLRAVWRRLGSMLIFVALISLYFLSVPAIGRALYHSLEGYQPLDLQTIDRNRLDAIVVLAGGRTNGPEYGEETVTGRTLVRLRYAAHLHRYTRLPLMVTGGRVFEHGSSEASLMRDALLNEFHVPVRWVEERSRNTAENALYTQQKLAAEGVERVILVTHAAHMPRAVSAFQAAGLQVVPAPTAFVGGSMADAISPMDWLPSVSALGMSAAAMHEYLGRLWYRVRYE